MQSTLTSKARLAVAIMTELSAQGGRGPVALSLISARQDISLSYLQQIVAGLRRHELVRAARGPGGGYTLGRKAEDITLADIILAVESPTPAEHLGSKPERSGAMSEYGGAPDMWACLREKLIECLSSISLKDITVPTGMPADPAVEETVARRGISTKPVLMPIRVVTPNSVFALGAAMSK